MYRRQNRKNERIKESKMRKKKGRKTEKKEKEKKERKKTIFCFWNHPQRDFRCVCLHVSTVARQR